MRGVVSGVRGVVSGVRGVVPTHANTVVMVRLHVIAFEGISQNVKTQEVGRRRMSDERCGRGRGVRREVDTPFLDLLMA